MQNKRRILAMGVLVLVVAMAAFIVGRFLNQNVNTAGSISVTIIPAIELPTASVEVRGAFVERRDNALIIETRSFDPGGAAVVPAVGSRGEGGPRVEVIVTSETVIYRENTQLSEPLSEENQIIQQTVEEGTLDDMNTRSMVMVWGRQSGDRVIADVLMYSDTAMIKSGLFENCEACP